MWEWSRHCHPLLHGRILSLDSSKVESEIAVVIVVNTPAVERRNAVPLGRTVLHEAIEGEISRPDHLEETSAGSSRNDRTFSYSASWNCCTRCTRWPRRIRRADVLFLHDFQLEAAIRMRHVLCDAADTSWYIVLVIVFVVVVEKLRVARTKIGRFDQHILYWNWNSIALQWYTRIYSSSAKSWPKNVTLYTCETVQCKELGGEKCALRLGAIVLRNHQCECARKIQKIIEITCVWMGNHGRKRWKRIHY